MSVLRLPAVRGLLALLALSAAAHPHIRDDVTRMRGSHRLYSDYVTKRDEYAVKVPDSEPGTLAHQVNSGLARVHETGRRSTLKRFERQRTWFALVLLAPFWALQFLFVFLLPARARGPTHWAPAMLFGVAFALGASIPAFLALYPKSASNTVLMFVLAGSVFLAARFLLIAVPLVRSGAARPYEAMSRSQERIGDLPRSIWGVLLPLAVFFFAGSYGAVRYLVTRLDSPSWQPGWVDGALLAAPATMTITALLLLGDHLTGLSRAGADGAREVFE